MAEYFRTVFLVSKPDVFGIDLLRKVADSVEAWGKDCFGPCEFDDSRREFTGKSGTLRIRRRELPEERLGISRLVWERPDPDDLTNRWRLSARVATDGLYVETDIEILGIETPNRALRDEYIAALPTIPAQLLEEFECRIGSARLTTTATEIAPDDVDSFLSDSLFGPERKMPLVVVSRDSSGRGADANRLQERLVGMADVVAYDHDTAWLIAKDLPRALRCYDGAIRLYAPGCSRDDVPQQNPYWMPSDETQLGPNRFWMMMRDECVNRVPTHTRRRLYASVLNSIRTFESERQEAELQRLEEMEAILQSTSKLRDDYEKGIKELDSAYEDVIKELDDDTPAVSASKRVARTFKNKNAILELEIEELKLQIKALTESRVGLVLDEADDSDEDHPEASSVEPPKAEFNGVIDAVNKANGALGRLRFLPTAFSSAESSQYRRPQEVYRALEVLNVCGKARSDGQLGVSIATWMSNFSLEYAADESEPTKARYSKERTFSDPERKIRYHMPAHIKIGGNQLRIHVFWETVAQEWLIGWVGDHLPTAGYNS